MTKYVKIFKERAGNVYAPYKIHAASCSRIGVLTIRVTPTERELKSFMHNSFCKFCMKPEIASAKATYAKPTETKP